VPTGIHSGTPVNAIEPKLAVLAGRSEDRGGWELRHFPPRQASKMEQKTAKSYRILCDLPGDFLVTLCWRRDYDDIAACVTYCYSRLEVFSGRTVRLQIRTCVTYRRLSQLLAPFSDERRVSPHVVGMLLAVVAHVVSARSVLFLLMRINVAEVIRVLGSPFPIGLLLLLATTFGSTTGLLPSVESRVRAIPTTTERTSPPREHTSLLRRTSSAQTDRTVEPIRRKVMWRH